VAYVVPRVAGGGAPEPEELRRFLRDSLPEHLVPAAVVLLDELPRLANGKVDPRALPEPEPAWADMAESYVPPRDAVERALAEIWAGVLGTDRIGVHDNFFEIGGDSILSIQVVARANRAGLALTPDQLFQHQTVAALAAVVGTAARGRGRAGTGDGAGPLTPIQHWFFEQGLAEPHHWHQSLGLGIPSELDPALLEQAVHQVVRQHDALRLRFAPEGAGWRQAHGEVDVPVPVHEVDLSALDEEEQERRVRRVVDELAAGTDLARGPLLRVARALRGGGRPDRLLLVAHHLVVDSISWDVVRHDLEAALSQLVRGEPVALPAKTTSFRAWAAALAARAAAGEEASEREHWLALDADLPRLPVDSRGVLTEASAETVTIALSAGETRSLMREVPAAYNTTPEEILLTALAQALGAWVPGERVLVGLERHGREAVAEGIDLSRTVGWFTSFFPVLLDLRGVHGAGPAIKAVKEQLRRVPGRGIGYGLLRYLGADAGLRERLRALPRPEVVFNYSRQGEAPAAAGAILHSTGAPTSSRGPRNHRGHLLELNVSPSAERLELHWTYSRDVHRRATVERVARDHLAALRALVEHSLAPGAGGYTPSDFPAAGLSQEELDHFLDTLLP
jgi:non-ribosomal peptide synthase protein (TIGR01720 family)